MRRIISNLILMCLFLSCTKKETTTTDTTPKICYSCELHNVVTAEVTHKDTCFYKWDPLVFKDKDGNNMNFICVPK